MVLCFVSTVQSRLRMALFASIRPAASLRALAAMIVAVLLVNQTSSALHELLVPHRVCAETGTAFTPAKRRIGVSMCRPAAEFQRSGPT